MASCDEGEYLVNIVVGGPLRSGGGHLVDTGGLQKQFLHRAPGELRPGHTTESRLEDKIDKEQESLDREISGRTG